MAKADAVQIPLELDQTAVKVGLADLKKSFQQSATEIMSSIALLNVGRQLARMVSTPFIEATKAAIKANSDLAASFGQTLKAGGEAVDSIHVSLGRLITDSATIRANVGAFVGLLKQAAGALRPSDGPQAPTVGAGDALGGPRQTAAQRAAEAAKAERDFAEKVLQERGKSAKRAEEQRTEQARKSAESERQINERLAIAARRGAQEVELQRAEDIFRRQSAELKQAADFFDAMSSLDRQREEALRTHAGIEADIRRAQTEEIRAQNEERRRMEAEANRQRLERMVGANVALKTTFDDFAKTLPSAADVLGGAMTSIFQSIGSGEDVLANLSKFFGGLLQQFGSALIGFGAGAAIMGLIGTVTGTPIGGGPAGIAAGAAGLVVGGGLVALGAAMGGSGAADASGVGAAAGQAAGVNLGTDAFGRSTSPIFSGPSRTGGESGVSSRVYNVTIGSGAIVAQSPSEAGRQIQQWLTAAERRGFVT